MSDHYYHDVGYHAAYSDFSTTQPQPSSTCRRRCQYHTELFNQHQKSLNLHASASVPLNASDPVSFTHHNDTPRYLTWPSLSYSAWLASTSRVRVANDPVRRSARHWYRSDPSPYRSSPPRVRFWTSSPYSRSISAYPPRSKHAPPFLCSDARALSKHDHLDSARTHSRSVPDTV
eukprot:3077582-Rhodomonas_salina.4